MRTQKKKQKQKQKQLGGGHKKMTTLDDMYAQLHLLYDNPIESIYVDSLCKFAGGDTTPANLDKMIPLIYELIAFAKQYAAEKIKNVMDAVLLSDDMIVKEATPLFDKYQTIFDINDEKEVREYTQQFIPDLVYIIRTMISVYAYQSTDDHPNFDIDFAAPKYDYKMHLHDQIQPKKLIIPYDQNTCKQLRFGRSFPKLKEGDNCIVVFPGIFLSLLNAQPLVKHFVIIEIPNDSSPVYMEN